VNAGQLVSRMPSRPISYIDHLVHRPTRTLITKLIENNFIGLKIQLNERIEIIANVVSTKNVMARNHE
jgi:hypothetical protein